MKLDSLLAVLDRLKIQADDSEFMADETPIDKMEYLRNSVIVALLEYIQNKRVEEKVNEISF